MLVKNMIVPSLVLVQEYRILLDPPEYLVIQNLCQTALIDLTLRFQSDIEHCSVKYSGTSHRARKFM